MSRTVRWRQRIPKNAPGNQNQMHDLERRHFATMKFTFDRRLETRSVGEKRRSIRRLLAEPLDGSIVHSRSKRSIGRTHWHLSYYCRTDGKAQGLSEWGEVGEPECGMDLDSFKSQACPYRRMFAVTVASKGRPLKMRSMVEDDERTNRGEHTMNVPDERIAKNYQYWRVGIMVLSVACFRHKSSERRQDESSKKMQLEALKRRDEAVDPRRCARQPQRVDNVPVGPALPKASAIPLSSSSCLTLAWCTALTRRTARPASRLLPISLSSLFLISPGAFSVLRDDPDAADTAHLRCGTPYSSAAHRVKMRHIAVKCGTSHAACRHINGTVT
ncbi:hypothetical protein C8R45DRAFT_1147398 [Mycena sanguinolenta]|nr:hypothetical protein C8R45DRAFT_1147398 [Mycena sanguinolenta]